MQAAKTNLHLNEFDMANLEYLKQASGLSGTEVVHEALGLCQTSLELRQQGYHTSVVSMASTSATISHDRVSDRFNHRSKKAEPVDVVMTRAPWALQAISDIKTSLKAEDSSVAVAYALEYAAACAKQVQNFHSGRIFFTKTNDPFDGYVLKNSAFNKTLKNRFKKAGRQMRQKLVKFSTRKKSPAPF